MKRALIGGEETARRYYDSLIQAAPEGQRAALLQDIVTRRGNIRLVPHPTDRVQRALSAEDYLLITTSSTEGWDALFLQWALRDSVEKTS